MQAIERVQSEKSEARVWSVGQLNRQVRASLEKHFDDVRVTGEISDCCKATSGHVYFTLSDPREPAQVRAVMFRTDARLVQALLKNGEAVCVRGTLTLYQPRGGYQLIVRELTAFGTGGLRKQLERLVAKLRAEGLLDEARKRTLPRYPRAVGVVTSRTGAALQDILRVAAKRFPVDIVVAPCTVQGFEAPRSIVTAIELVQKVRRVELIIVGRGGGSAEDLVAFNDESVARAIAQCRVPVVSAVGHEVDVTLADLVADVRAATPSHAAEQVLADLDAVHDELRARQRGLERSMELTVGRRRLELHRLMRSFAPDQRLHQVRRKIQTLLHRAQVALQHRLRREREQVRRTQLVLSQHDPRRILALRRAVLQAQRNKLSALCVSKIQVQHAKLQTLQTALQRRAERALERKQAVFAERMAQLHALSPLRVLERGYAVARLDGMEGAVITRSSQAHAGQVIHLRLRAGALLTQVVKVEDES